MSTSDPYYPLIAGDSITITGNTWAPSLDLKLPEDDHFRALEERVSAIERRLAILDADEELQARFPALQEAYDNYKLIEKLVNDRTKT